MIKEYIKYLKNNPEKYWFRAKLYGWGWTPARWQGWLTLTIFIVLLVLNFYRFDYAAQNSISESPILFALENILLAIILIGICIKTGEKPRWQWGLKNKDEEMKK